MNLLCVAHLNLLAVALRIPARGRLTRATGVRGRALLLATSTLGKTAEWSPTVETASAIGQAYNPYGCDLCGKGDCSKPATVNAATKCCSCAADSSCAELQQGTMAPCYLEYGCDLCGKGVCSKPATENAATKCCSCAADSSCADLQQGTMDPCPNPDDITDEALSVP